MIEFGIGVVLGVVWGCGLVMQMRRQLGNELNKQKALVRASLEMGEANAALLDQCDKLRANNDALRLKVRRLMETERSGRAIGGVFSVN